MLQPLLVVMGILILFGFLTMIGTASLLSAMFLETAGFLFAIFLMAIIIASRDPLFIGLMLLLFLKKLTAKPDLGSEYGVGYRGYGTMRNP